MFWDPNFWADGFWDPNFWDGMSTTQGAQRHGSTFAIEDMKRRNRKKLKRIQNDDAEVMKIIELIMRNMR